MQKKQQIAVTATMICAFATAQAADNQLTADEQQMGWQLLFDGKDLAQWRNFKSDTLNAKWQIHDGAIMLTGEGGGDILTKKSYGDFDLQLEWKVSAAGNSGIFFMADETGNAIYSHAPEVQILDNAAHADNKLDSHRSGSLYDLVAAPAASQKPAGEWNQVRIRLQDQHLEVWQNGISTTSIVIGSSTWKTLVANSKFATWSGFGVSSEGHIGLQDHGDPVWFRNLRIKEL